MRMPASSHQRSAERVESAGPNLSRRSLGGSSPQHDRSPLMNEVLRSPGQPLDQSTRSFMQSRFGHDFSRVSVHADDQVRK